ncbi:MAG: glycosyltransferase family 2 protein [Verrucomicrobiota bacterium]|nr:glycosyltransferase family 2 protein [Verrucomicrobiota bacterium]
MIPCAAQHFVHLEPLLDLLAQQTRLPEEVVVSLSEVVRLEKRAMDELEEREWPFQLKILRHEGKRSAGMNRNLACKAVTGDLIICQDADDIPHPQRVEIVGYLFEHYAITHLLHTYVYKGEFAPYRKEEVIPYEFYNYDHLEAVYQDRLHNGNVSFLREVAKRVQWDDVFECDHDVKFNRDVYRWWRKGATIDCNLLIYRQPLSAFNPANIPWANEM